MNVTEMKARLRSTLRMPVRVDEAAEMLARQRGSDAEALLNNTAFTEALADVERVYMEAWRNSLGTDIELRERAHVAISLLADLKNLLIARVSAGKVSLEKLRASLQS